ncbi:MAG: hypothetical protein H8E94_08315 [Alphaproteobacteria bacterium]|nr:hypothetical protein [Alphaproteobacteria bacterium]
MHGDADEIIPISSVDKLVQKLSSQKNIVIDYRIIKGADHFYADQLAELNGYVADYLDQWLEKTAQAAQG